ncbi:MAG: slipin family protein [Candidatus Omnitrophica bacterium]|nr:slipin family protein [Candidatus Omnitrophota bacterium]MCM8817005.1 slipin family protein [Candidatus Omnitrophota bacterium]
MPIFLPILIFVAIIIISNTIKIVPQYERGVVFRLGKLMDPPRGPGLTWLIPGIERMVRVSLRTVTFDVTPQEVMTRDNVPIKVNAVVWFRVMDPAKAIVEVENYHLSTMQIAQTTLRGVLGQMELDEILSERDKINHRLQQIIDEQTDPWGIKVSIVEIKEVELPDTMKRAMARQAEVERERRAKIINAEGEYQASEKLVAAAKKLSEVPIAIQLRYLQTASEIATEKNSTLVFPIPLEMFSVFRQMSQKSEQT